jgi:uncharacterized protein (TIGR01777 family)
VRIAVTGSSGLIGSALLPALRADGHDVVRLVRRPARAADEISWDPAAGTIDSGGLAGIDGAVHLAGANIGGSYWTPAYKAKIRASRVESTATLSRALARLSPRPRVLLSASGVGWYGDAGDEPVDETAPAGSTFFAGVVREWESATAPAQDAGIRTVFLRSGIVVSRAGGACGRLWPLFRFGLGARLGSGRQWWSWIHLDDEVDACRLLLARDDIEGPVNLTSPQPVTNATFTKAMGRAVQRPTPWLVPAPALRRLTGGLGQELLASQRAIPARLSAAGYNFRFADIDSALIAASPRKP